MIPRISKIPIYFSVLLRSVFSRKIILCFVFLSKSVFGFSVDAKGTCPADIDIYDENQFVITSAPTLFVGADDDSPVDKALSELFSMHTEIEKIDETEFRLLFRSSRTLDGKRVCAWIDKRDILPKLVEPLKVDTPIDWTDPITGKTEEIKNPLPLKAVLRSLPEAGSEATSVNIYDRPSKQSNVRSTGTVFGVYFIYADQVGDDGEFWYWIAGADDPFFPTKFAGWVNEDSVMLWESQLSLYFNDQVEGTEIFVDQDHAGRKDLKGRMGKRPKNYYERTVGQPKKEEGSSGLVNKSNIARFPILEEVKSAADGRQSIYRIGYFGDDKNVEKNSAIAKIERDILNVDILFVLDNTLSMTEYFPSVVKAVRNSTKEIKRINDEGDHNVDVRFAAATYGDYLDKADLSTENLQFDIISRLGLPGYSEHLDKLSEIASIGNYYKDTFSDKPEAGLAGVIAGIEKLEWSSNARTKVIVWVGDHGSRAVGENEIFSVEEVKAALEENQMLLLPINVSGRYDKLWNTKFVEQGDVLASVISNKFKTRVAHQNSASNDFATVQQFIEESIANMYVASVTANLAVRDRRSSEEILAERPDLLNLGIPAAEADVAQISRAICEMAFGDDGCELVSSTGQFMSEGFVRYDESLKNFNFWVNLDSEDLSLMKDVLEKTCKGLNRGSVKKAIERAMQTVQQVMSEDDDVYRPDIPVGLYLRRFFLLPATHFPSFLESTPDRIDEIWQDAFQTDADNGNRELTSQIAYPICRSAKLLDLVEDGKRLIDVETDLVPTTTLTGEPTYSWSVADQSRLVDFDWEWYQGGENNFYYLPVDFLPGRLAD